ncbi:MAG: transcription antitermination factor NusB [bacterium]|jgi:N utilization substance protein B|nr:transcription antitermination factor NusB [bacterium]MDD3805450.1 transcription antitermination factor NusB [bacterium]MDD4153319.1 transcription antitermination factor NusB [bacterium]
MGKRSRARERAFQILFQIDVGCIDAGEAIKNTLEETQLSEEARNFAIALVQGTLEHINELDELIAKHARGWTIERMVNVDRTIIRMAVYELLYHTEVPYKVTINEAVELAKKYGTEDSGLFVNGILGGIIKASGRAGAGSREAESRRR